MNVLEGAGAAAAAAAAASSLFKKSIGRKYLYSKISKITIQSYIEDKGQAYIISPVQGCSKVFFIKPADMSGNMVDDHDDQI